MQELHGKQVERFDEVGEECRPETFEPCHAERKSVEAEEMKIDPSKNTIVCGDAKNWLQWLNDESIDACYIDPPFFSNSKYEVVWGNGYEIRSFDDRFSGGINKYIEWMEERVRVIHRKLKKNGQIFLHCDWHANYRLRLMLDSVFENGFKNEIIWYYENKLGTGHDDIGLQSKHDTILRYVKNQDCYVNNPLMIPVKKVKLQPVTKKENGKRIWQQNPDGSKCYAPGKSEKPRGDVWKGIGFKEDDQTQIQLEEQGDVFEIPYINPASNERLGYKTQKPEKLITEIIKLCTNEGDTVLDCFAGSGTTAVCAFNLGRNFVIGDVSPVAVRICTERLRRSEIRDFDIIGIPRTVEEFRNKFDKYEFQKLVCDIKGWMCGPKGTDGGRDGKDGNGDPVQVKSASATPNDIRAFATVIRLQGKQRGAFVAYSFSEGSNGCKEEIARLKQIDKIEIQEFLWQDILSPFIASEEEMKKIEHYYTERFPSHWEQGNNISSVSGF
jgi:DNA modification methylase